MPIILGNGIALFQNETQTIRLIPRQTKQIGELYQLQYDVVK